MHRTFTVMALCLTIGAVAFSQPRGSLYIAGSEKLEVVQFPDGQQQLIDTIPTTDVLRLGTYVFASGRHWDYDSLLAYELPTYRRVAARQDSVIRLTAWNDRLVTLRLNAPYVRVYNPAPGLSPSFSLVNAGGPPTDLELVGDLLYVLQADTLSILDLNARVVMRRIPFQPPVFGPGTGGGRFLSYFDEDMYVWISYFTAVPRTSLLRYNPLQNRLDTVIEVVITTGDLTYRPVATPDRIWVFAHPEHFTSNPDSLHRFVSTGQRIDYAMAFDSASGATILWGVELGAGALRELSFDLNGNQTFVAPVDNLQAVYWDPIGETRSVNDPRGPVPLRIAVEPGGGAIRVWVENLPNARIELFDASGRSIDAMYTPVEGGYRVATPALAAGMYALRVVGAKRSGWARFMHR